MIQMIDVRRVLAKLLWTGVCLLAGLPSVLAAEQWKPNAQWGQGLHFRFFVGGDAGDSFASIIYKGAQQAEKDLGVKVDYVFSGWNIEKMMSQFREAVAAHPDGIAFVGHAGDEALMPLVKQATNAGILVAWLNTDVPRIRAEYGQGYTGVLDQTAQGQALGEAAIKRLGIEPDGEVIVLGPFDQPGRFTREDSVAKTFEAAGHKVTRINSKSAWTSDTNLAIPVITGALLAHPKTRLVVFPGGQLLGKAPVYMQAAGKKPGEVKCIGFDTSAEVINAFEQGYVQMTSDQQPFLQGYLPLLSMALTKRFGFAPLVNDTGKGIISADNYKMVATLAQQGLR